ncbi:MAG TPA: hypothetical protein VF407_04155 [Polyangiaceae bacterium]
MTGIANHFARAARNFTRDVDRGLGPEKMITITDEHERARANVLQLGANVVTEGRERMRENRGAWSGGARGDFRDAIDFVRVLVPESVGENAAYQASLRAVRLVREAAGEPETTKKARALEGETTRRRRSEHEASGPRRRRNRELHRHHAAQRDAEDVGALDFAGVENGAGVARERLDRRPRRPG